MRAYTDLEQSKKLTEILPLESADMRFCFSHTLGGRITGHYPMIGREPSMGTIPCWSLAALFSMLPKSAYLEKGSSTELCRVTLPVELISSDWNLEPIDACVDIIIKLHEQNLL
jgi:hypothetical protein